ncbi:MAG: peroxidase-related enzyme [Thermoplasmata archaeon]
MSWIQVIEPRSAEGTLAEVYREVGRRRGEIADIHQVQSLNPRAMKAHLDLYMSIVYRRGELSRAQREMIGVAVSRLNRCPYCVIHHAEALSHYEKSPEVVDGVQVDYREAALRSEDRAMLDYAAKLTTSPSTMTQGDIEALREAGFGEEAILDINLIASYFNFVNRVVHGLGVELEPEDARVYRYKAEE